MAALVIMLGLILPWLVPALVARSRGWGEIAMFVNAQEMLAFTYEGRQLRVPEIGSWVEFDCTSCGTHTTSPIDGGALECEGCEAYSFVPAEWSRS